MKVDPVINPDANIFNRLRAAGATGPCIAVGGRPGRSPSGGGARDGAVERCEVVAAPAGDGELCAGGDRRATSVQIRRQPRPRC